MVRREQRPGVLESRREDWAATEQHPVVSAGRNDVRVGGGSGKAEELIKKSVLSAIQPPPLCGGLFFNKDFPAPCNKLSKMSTPNITPQMMGMLGNSYTTSGGLLSQNHLASMGILNDVNLNDSSPFDINDFPQLTGRPSSSGGQQGQLGSLRKQGISSIVQQNQEFSIQNEDFPALPGFKASALDASIPVLFELMKLLLVVPPRLLSGVIVLVHLIPPLNSPSTFHNAEFRVPSSQYCDNRGHIDILTFSTLLTASVHSVSTCYPDSKRCPPLRCGSSDFPMDMRQKEKLHENVSMLQSQHFPMSRSVGFNLGGTYTSSRQQQQQHATGASFTHGNNQEFLHLRGSDLFSPSHGNYQSQVYHLNMHNVLAEPRPTETEPNRMVRFDFAVRLVLTYRLIEDAQLQEEKKAMTMVCHLAYEDQLSVTCTTIKGVFISEAPTAHQEESSLLFEDSNIKVLIFLLQNLGQEEEIATQFLLYPHRVATVEEHFVETSLQLNQITRSPKNPSSKD
ncbi:hypothetical protein KSP40_PGU004913 [Platanthera guangdongensis]|uniref:Uncharacterized protein n=1 Tax=Platanthera guangdongensis TaxID=2320717 RepID=A0ABR2MJR1_9ASPA